MNLYRKRYGIPDDLMVRKADFDIRQTVNDSDAIKKLELMLESCLHPSLIFFEKDMSEDRIQKCIANLHGSPQIQNIFQEINAILTSGTPHLNLMFHPRKNQYLIKKVAGFIHAPYNFDPIKLKEYCQTNANVARSHAREFVQSQKTKSRIDQIINKARGKL